MEVCVITHSCPSAYLLAGLLASGASKFISKVCLVGDGSKGRLETGRYVTQKGSFELSIGDRLKFISLGTATESDKSQIRACHVIALCAYKHKQEFLGTWFKSLCVELTSVVLVLTIGGGADCGQFLKDLPTDKLEPYLIRGCFGPTSRLDHTRNGFLCRQTSLGHCVIERLSKKKAQFVQHILILEKASSLCFLSRNLKQINNWTHADTLWKSLQLLATCFAEQDKKNHSLYEHLSSERFRRLCATWLQEALYSLEGENLSLLDVSTSPFGLNVQRAIILLRLPEPYFGHLLRTTIRFSSLGHPESLVGCPYGESNNFERKELLVTLLHHGVDEEKQKLMALVATRLSSTQPGKSVSSAGDADCEPVLVPCISKQRVISYLSLAVLGIAIFARYLVHAYTVLVYK